MSGSILDPLFCRFLALALLLCRALCTCAFALAYIGGILTGFVIFPNQYRLKDMGHVSAEDGIDIGKLSRTIATIPDNKYCSYCTSLKSVRFPPVLSIILELYLLG